LQTDMASYSAPVLQLTADSEQATRTSTSLGLPPPPSKAVCQ